MYVLKYSSCFSPIDCSSIYFDLYLSFQRDYSWRQRHRGEPDLSPAIGQLAANIPKYLENLVTLFRFIKHLLFYNVLQNTIV